MIAHTHLLQGDTDGCPVCDRVAGRLVQPDPAAVVDDEPREPASVAALPEGTHRIRDGRPVCDGGREHRCHWYSDCDCEGFLCEHEYVYHDDCWIIGWLDPSDLDDTVEDDSWEHRTEDGHWPDGTIAYTWEVDFVTWRYVELDPDPGVPSGRRDSDVPLWDDDAELAGGAS